MSRLNPALLSLLTVFLNSFLGWLISQLPGKETLSIPSTYILGLTALCTLLIAFVSLQPKESRTSAKATDWWLWVNGLPLMCSVILYILLNGGHVPAEFKQAVGYAALGLFVVGALLPTVQILLRTRFSGRELSFSRSNSLAVEPNSSHTLTFTRQNVQTRYKLLENVKSEVEGRLESSLHKAKPINLLKEKQFQQVECKWAVEVKIGNQAITQQPSSTKIIEVFDQKAIAGKLLILGDPGAGKTTTLLEIARDLCERVRCNLDEPIPVLFNLSTWKDDKQSIADWLVAQLKDKLGVRVDIGRQLLENRQLLPLLDGLDEIESERQEQCVQAINQFLEQLYSPKYLVVCCRRAEYELCNTKLQLNGAVYLQPLTYAQIHDYLVELERPKLWQSIKNEPELLKLVKSPLLLSILTLAYEGMSLLEWHQRTSPEARRQYLFDVYIERMLQREIKHRWYSKGKEPTPEKTKRWLVWLARRLKDEATDEFLIEKMQPSWLHGAQKQIYHFANGIIGGLIIGLIGGLFVEFTSNNQIKALTFGLISGPMSGLILGFQQRIKPVETVKWTGVKARRGMILGLIIGSIYGLISWPTFTLVHNSTIGLSKVLFYDSFFGTLGFGLFGGAIGALLGGFSGPNIQKRTIPNQGIWRSAANTGTFALIGGLMGPLGVLIGAIVPATACIQHFTLRLILWRNGYIPWNYARFLNYANERVFLQRVGGRYRFIHDLLQEHFAAMK